MTPTGNYRNAFLTQGILEPVDSLFYTELAFLESARELMSHLRAGRGSWLFGELEQLNSKLEGGNELFDDTLNDQIISFQMKSTSSPQANLTPVRPIPEPDNWFEKDWKEFREDNRFKPKPEQSDE